MFAIQARPFLANNRFLPKIGTTKSVNERNVFLSNNRIFKTY